MNQSFLQHFQWKRIQNEKYEDIWEISGFIFDIAFQKVVGCIYKKWFLHYTYFLFEAILEQKENMYVIVEKDSENEWYEICGKRVQNEYGSHLWYICDVEINITHTLQYIYIESGYFLSLDRKNLFQRNTRKISAKAIVSYEKESIIIKDTTFIKENKKTLENIRKVFINIPEPNYNLNFNTYE